MFVPINRGNIKDNIQEQILDAKEEYKWTPQEIEHQLRAIKKLNSRGNPNNGQPQATPQVPQEAPQQRPQELLEEAPQEAPQKALSVQAPSAQDPST